MEGLKNLKKGIAAGKTGKGREGEGIPPDAEAPASEALDVALREARKLAAAE